MAEDEWGVEALLSMDGQRGEVGSGYWFKIEARRVPPTEAVPHGIKYSLTLHDPNGPRIFGMDNAHLPNDVQQPRRGLGKVRKIEWDHKHIGSKTTVYEYSTDS